MPCLSEPMLGIFPLFFLISTASIALIASLHIARKPKLSIKDGSIIYQTVFPAQKEIYPLNTITDFTWSGRPAIARSRSGSQIKLNNDSFELSFKENEPLSITGDQYANFDEIRNFFYSYCIKHDIIEVRPLEERKRSRFWARRK